MRYVGVDVSKRKCRAAFIDEDGEIVEEFSFRNDFVGISMFLSRLSLGDRVVMESTGNLWVNLYDALEERGFSVVLANPLKMKAIASAKIKNDKVDARILAYLLRGDLVAESYVPSREVRDLRVLVRYRASLVRARTAIKNRVHSLLDRYGLKHGFSDLFGKAGLEWLRSLELSPLDRLILDGYIEHIECLNRLIRNVEGEILRRASMDEDVRLLFSLTGVGVYTALLIKSEIGDIRRFPNYKKLVSWAGLAPSLHQSGSIERHGRITKQGSRMLRWVMVEAARTAVRYDCRLREFYERVRRRRGGSEGDCCCCC
ncbi:MAG TPA: IS110 family transposase [Candidatus Bathyarchaeota archaeon]|nr:IS110 family transposase [Candidatus Bathyarchaeota archaeon]